MDIAAEHRHLVFLARAEDDLNHIAIALWQVRGGNLVPFLDAFHADDAALIARNLAPQLLHRGR
ncbi:MAG: hypothetical protein IAE87_08575 [Rhodobacteraceae bacterium]|nr:hypothetical protein [Paracoccaceae bacterium]